MRTIRLCEGDNVTSFVMPPISQKPIPISFVKAPKDMTRFGKRVGKEKKKEEIK
jgi:hypothetical protein